jgi:SAM-dependent methyltransferase
MLGVDFRRQMVWSAATACRDTKGIYLIQANGISLPFPDESVDVVVSSLTLHHFDDEGATRLVREMARVARQAVIVSDLERNRFNYVGARILGSTLWRRDHYIRADGPLSVRRAFTRAELGQIGIAAGLRSPAVHRHFPYRLALVGGPPARGRS